MNDKTIVIDISLQKSMLEFIDMWRNKVMMNRSEFIREACRQYILKIKEEHENNKNA